MDAYGPANSRATSGGETRGVRTSYGDRPHGLQWARWASEAIDRWTGADTRAIEDLQRRMTEFQAKVDRLPSLADLLIILAFGFVGSWVSYVAGGWVADGISRLADEGGSGVFAGIRESISASTWKYIIVTALGLGLSFTRARNLEGAGASRIGSVMIYLLVACIGASADFAKILEAPAFILMGFSQCLGIASLVRCGGRDMLPRQRDWWSATRPGSTFPMNPASKCLPLMPTPGRSYTSPISVGWHSNLPEGALPLSVSPQRVITKRHTSPQQPSFRIFVGNSISGWW